MTSFLLKHSCLSYSYTSQMCLPNDVAFPQFLANEKINHPLWTDFRFPQSPYLKRGHILGEAVCWKPFLTGNATMLCEVKTNVAWPSVKERSEDAVVLCQEKRKPPFVLLHCLLMSADGSVDVSGTSCRCLLNSAWRLPDFSSWALTVSTELGHSPWGWQGYPKIFCCLRKNSNWCPCFPTAASPFNVYSVQNLAKLFWHLRQQPLRYFSHALAVKNTIVINETTDNSLPFHYTPKSGLLGFFRWLPHSA